MSDRASVRGCIGTLLCGGGEGDGAREDSGISSIVLL